MVCQHQVFVANWLLYLQQQKKALFLLKCLLQEKCQPKFSLLSGQNQLQCSVILLLMLELSNSSISYHSALAICLCYPVTPTYLQHWTRCLFSLLFHHLKQVCLLDEKVHLHLFHPVLSKPYCQQFFVSEFCLFGLYLTKIAPHKFLQVLCHLNLKKQGFWKHHSTVQAILNLNRQECSLILAFFIISFLNNLVLYSWLFLLLAHHRFSNKYQSQ